MLFIGSQAGMQFLFFIGRCWVFISFSSPPRSSWFLLWFVLTGFTGAVRFALRDLLLSLSSVVNKQTVAVVIYGAGEAGAQLAAALRLAGNHQIISFLDDSPSLWGRSINGISIQPPQSLRQIQVHVDQVLLAIPL